MDDKKGILRLRLNEMKNFFSKPLNKFLLIFLSILSSYYILVMFSFFTQFLSDFAGIGAKISSIVINFFGGDANNFQNYLISNGNSMQVGIGCDGSEPMVLLIAAISAYQSKFNKKLSGILIGTIVLFLVNQFRIIGLFFFNNNLPDYFNLMHNDVFPIITVIISGFLFYSWIRVFNK